MKLGKIVKEWIVKPLREPEPLRKEEPTRREQPVENPVRVGK